MGRPSFSREYTSKELLSKILTSNSEFKTELFFLSFIESIEFEM